jgi:type IV secretory pathway VirB3-like protein
VVRQATLFLALTRPPLTWGVPFWGFWINVACVFYGGAFFQAPTFWRQPMWIWALGVATHFLLRELTAHDYHWAHTIRLWFETLGMWLLASLPRKDVRGRLGVLSHV